ncbi:AAA ATPase domain-containing protein [Microbacterium sp. ru370.1]|uniref:LuxR C-terminal-related transcriptional regulator n=1 Tax=unclassified Microbacterium TaxID=2609290 RepID=UPI000891D984|nr:MULTISPECIES: LuxR C-terminal-related transcriptional regulator [unclassified Microbacterium]SDO72853.1 AAA ATPase domain-containing protein [Microbacterium sp. ru370.1]SIT87692.1 AAA ATPase domain-containing protein [Microbacterium sp. RU1D]
MPIVGCQRELQVAASLIGSGSGAAGLFVGDIASGKTTLAREIAARHGGVLLTASPNERMWPLSGLTAVISALDDVRSAAVDTVIARGRDWPEHLIAEEVSRTLHLLRADPCLVVIDDLDEMDSASINVLSYVFARLRGTGVSVMATIGTFEGRHDFAGLLQTRIRRLSFAESVELAGHVLGPGAARAVLHVVAELTAGDPGILTALRLTPAEVTGEDPLALPLRVVDPASHRRPRNDRQHDPRLSALLDLLAVGPVYAMDRLRDTARADGVDVEDLLEDGTVVVHGELARIADTAHRLRRHARLRPEQRRALHARAAEDHAVDYPATRRWHESFLDPAADRARLLQGAVLLTREDEVVAAVEFAERALAGDIDESRRCDLLVELGDAMVLDGHDLLAQHYLRRAGVSADPDTRLRAAIARLRAGAVADHVVDDSVLAHADPRIGADPAASEMLLCESAALHLHRGEVDAAVACVAMAIERGVASTQTALLARIADEMRGCRPLGAPPDAVGGAETGAIDVPDDETPVEQALLWAGLHLLHEEYPAARRVVRAQLDRSPRIAPMWREHLLRQSVAIDVRAGDPESAQEAVTAWRREWIPGRSSDAASTLVLAAAAALQSPPVGAEDLVRQGRERARREGATALLPWFDGVEGSVFLADGRYTEAVDLLCAARTAASGADPAMMRTQADLVEALWLAGRHAEARRELERFESDAAAAPPRRWTILALARSRAVCVSDRDGLEAFRVAEGVFRSDDAPLEHSRLRRARERCLPRDAASALRPLMPATGTGEGRGALTAHEREIVELVERGLRNREIASALFVSLRTVELRLTGIYRKLGVTSRVQLVGRLRGAVG